MNNLKNNQAFTLIEVLASITILGIVITVFLSFFSNATLFSSKTEDKLTAINLAEKELYEVTTDIESYCQNPHVSCLQPADVDVNLFTRLPIPKNNKNYFSIVTPLAQNHEENLLRLLPISVKIESADNKELTTVYGYVKLDPTN